MSQMLNLTQGCAKLTITFQLENSPVPNGQAIGDKDRMVMGTLDMRAICLDENSYPYANNANPHFTLCVLFVPNSLGTHAKNIVNDPSFMTAVRQNFDNTMLGKQLSKTKKGNELSVMGAPGRYFFCIKYDLMDQQALTAFRGGFHKEFQKRLGFIFKTKTARSADKMVVLGGEISGVPTEIGVSEITYGNNVLSPHISVLSEYDLSRGNKLLGNKLKGLNGAGAVETEVNNYMNVNEGKRLLSVANSTTFGNRQGHNGSTRTKMLNFPNTVTMGHTGHGHSVIVDIVEMTYDMKSQSLKRDQTSQQIVQTLAY